MQHLSRLLGRGRALKVLLTSQDYDADVAENLGWVNRSLPDGELNAFVTGSRTPDRELPFPRFGGDQAAR